jgi:hypothetical protein
MELETARRHIQSCLERMRACYLQPVFDEWAILAASAPGGVAAYEGPRPDRFRRELPGDTELLRSTTRGKEHADGDLEFVSDAVDTHYDAFVKAGPGCFLILNHTKKTLKEIRADPKWLDAQAVLFELTEKFRVDPLQL